MATTATPIDPEHRGLGEVELVGRDRWEEIRRLALAAGSRRAGVDLVTMVGAGEARGKERDARCAGPVAPGSFFGSKSATFSACLPILVGTAALHVRYGSW